MFVFQKTCLALVNRIFAVQSVTLHIPNTVIWTRSIKDQECTGHKEIKIAFKICQPCS